MSSYVFELAGRAISWKSVKQNPHSFFHHVDKVCYEAFTKVVRLEKSLSDLTFSILF